MITTGNETYERLARWAYEIGKEWLEEVEGKRPKRPGRRLKPGSRTWRMIMAFKSLIEKGMGPVLEEREERLKSRLKTVLAAIIAEEASKTKREREEAYRKALNLLPETKIDEWFNRITKEYRGILEDVYRRCLITALGECGMLGSRITRPYIYKVYCADRALDAAAVKLAEKDIPEEIDELVEEIRRSL